MLNLKKVLGAKPKEHVESTLAELFTPWGETLDKQHILEEHPDPQFARTTFSTLNGVWNCAFEKGTHAPTDDLAAVVSNATPPADDSFDRQIVVPFSPESILSGVHRQLQPDELLWYRRELPAGHAEANIRCILHFQAVDYACACFVNGHLAGTHVGGYLPFQFDITDFLSDGSNELMLCVADPSEFGGKLRGKQRFDRGDIWYSAQSGIWQTVWIEQVPTSHITSISLNPDAQTETLLVVANLEYGQSSSSEEEHPLSLGIAVYDENGALVAQETQDTRKPTCAVKLHIPNAQLWSPETPYLYSLRLTFENDVVESYFGFRSVRMGTDKAGRKFVFLNEKPLFIKGVLDQAYWSDGLMTAPSDDALVFDIEAMRDAGFNLMRKHIKIESARWYYHCDRMGMLVLQDMVSGGSPEINLWHWSYKPTLFKVSWNHYRDDTPKHQMNLGAGDAAYRDEWTSTCRETIGALGNHPCIIGWSLFNEGWGQFDARSTCQMVKRIDPTRVVDAVSGWYDQRCGDFKSVHNYFRDLTVWPDRLAKRAFFVSEFGGYTHRVEGHSSLDEAYGYEPFDDVREWRRTVRESLAHMDSLESKGLAGYIYTQVSDIEEETNGILTYDRRVNKLASD